MSFQEKKLYAIALIITCMLIPTVSAATISVEQTTSIRMSIRSWTSASITEQQLLIVLRDAYGNLGDHRSVPKVGTDYSLTLFVANATGSYLYNPETNTLIVHNLSVTKDSLRARLDQGYDASALLIIVWNQTKMNNVYFASAETGCLVQNVYLSAASIGLGTVCVALINSDGLRTDLNLQNTMTPLIVMPLGYPTSSYPTATPKYSIMNGNLPPVQYSTRSLESALNNLLYARTWSNKTITTQELSQLLWAAYGYCSTDHRTVPSAANIYALKIFVSNATGIYEYTPGSHSITTIVQGDKRLEIANACGGETWAANAPAALVVAYDSTLYGDGGVVSHEWIEVDAGTVVQNILLEASAWGLSGNIVSKGLESWDGAGSGAIRTILGASSSLIPLYVVPVGHDGQIPEFSPILILPAFIILAFIAVAIFKVQHRTRTEPGDIGLENCT